MKCEKCGAEIKSGDKFCKYCGNQIQSENQVIQNQKAPDLEIPRKKSNAGLIVGIFLGVIILLVIGLTLISNNSEPEESVNNEIENIIENIDENKTGQNDKNSTIDFKGYTFKVPSDVTASVSGNQLFIYGPKSKWIGVVMTETSKYENLLLIKDQIITALSAQENSESYDLTNATTEEKQYGGKSFLVTSNIKSSSYDLDISYAKADDDNVYVVSLTKSDSTPLTEQERNEMYGIIVSSVKK